MSAYTLTLEESDVSNDDIFKISCSFLSRLGFPLEMWAFTRGKKIILGDGRSIAAEIGTVGDLNLMAISSLVESYGLALMDDNSVMDVSNRPLDLRISSFIQAMIAVDGILRTWEGIKQAHAK